MNDQYRTDFAPAERSHPENLTAQREFLRIRMEHDPILDSISEIVIILNEHRQIVFTNKRLLELLNTDVASVLGKRPGEVLNCIHSDETPGGCGTTDSCRECGAVNAILAAQGGNQAVRECRILTHSGSAMELRVWATPMEADGMRFTVFSASDISQEKRREALERTFFHDILNTAGTVSGAAELLLSEDMDDPKPFLSIVSRGAGQLLEEIRSHRLLLAAENGTLVAEYDAADPLEIVEAVKSQYGASPLSQGRTLQLDPASESLTFRTDKTLLRRILGNLTKNALEATPRGGVVTLACRRDGDGVVFSVRNPRVMEDSVRRQVFQRSFSTKGPGRGIGTFSVKLFTESYLGGKAWFETREGLGTEFHVKLPLEPQTKG